MPAKLNLIGQTFGKLKVIAEAESIIHPCGHTARRSVCLCDCGTESIVLNGNLRSGITRSCGCIWRTVNITHGHLRDYGKSATYYSWVSMIQRCTNPQSTGYENYGGRGILVCERWKDFKNFLADMGERPDGKSIDRYPDNNGNYEPGNCRWATDVEQRRNRSKSLTVTFAGITSPLVDLCEKFGVPYARTKERLKMGWSVEDAFTVPRR